MESNNLSNDTDKGVLSLYSKLSDISKSSPLYIFIPLSFLSVFENFRVISVVLSLPPRKRKAGHLLIAHLSFIHLLITFISGDYLLSKFGHVNLVDKSGAVCAVRSYLRNVVISVLPLNVAAVNFEKTQIFRNSYYHGGNFLFGRCIAIMWTLAVIINLPNILTVKFLVLDSQDHSKCQEDLLLSNMWITIGYEFIKLILFNLLPIGYIVYTLVIIKSVVYKYIFECKKELTDEIKGKRRKIKLVLANAIVFAIFWLPTGVLLFGYKIYCRLNLNEKQSKPVENTKPNDDATTAIFMAIMITIFFTYVALNPLIHLHLNTHLNEMKWYQFSFQRKRINREVKETNDEVRNPGNSNRRRRSSSHRNLQNKENPMLHDTNMSAVFNEMYATSVISRISTFQVSTPLRQSPHNSKISDDVEIFV